MKQRTLFILLAMMLAAGLLLLTQFGVSLSAAQSQQRGMTGQELQAFEQASNQPTSQTDSTISYELLTKASPDECYDGIGNPYPPGPPCDVGQPKVNQAYIWGMTEHSGKIWFGTMANTMCLFGTDLVGHGPNENAYWVCEFGESQYAPPLADKIGDWRPPHIYTYNPTTDALTDVTPQDLLIYRTLGFRSATSDGRLVILAGPGLYTGVNFFYFNGETGEYLGSYHSALLNNIRRWVKLNGVLYTTVGLVDGTGAVLRWRGNSEDLTKLNRFEIVGRLDAEGAELAIHDDRLFVATWPNDSESRITYTAGLASLYMSPEVPAGGGLTWHDTQNWQKVWEVNDYEPDPLIATTYGMGSLISYEGYLYWGTMHVPLNALNVFYDTYGKPGDPDEQLAATIGCSRALAIFRGRDFGTDQQQVELLYGLRKLPTYTPETGWVTKFNNMGGALPLYGLAGFGNVKNNYTWGMAVYHDDLYVGTMDWGTITSVPTETLGIEADTTLGSDLYRFPSSTEPAVPENTDGFGNFANYGIRNMMIYSDAIYLGTANPMNLLTNLEDEWPEGGWELIRVTAP